MVAPFRFFVATFRSLLNESSATVVFCRRVPAHRP